VGELAVARVFFLCEDDLGFADEEADARDSPEIGGMIRIVGVEGALFAVDAGTTSDDESGEVEHVVSVQIADDTMTRGWADVVASEVFDVSPA
jgi:hypothetical protein